MRVTTFGVNAQYMSDLTDIMTKYQQLEQQMSTGRKLNQPSDDPVAFETDIQSQTQQAQVSQWQDNVTAALSATQNSDSAMSTLTDTLGGLRTHLVSASNGTHTPADISNMLSSVKQTVASVAQVADTSDGQQYIFGGTNGKQALISVQPNGTLNWTSGTTPMQSLTIGANVRVGIGVDGSALFNSAPVGTVNPSLISTLNSIVNDMTSAANAPNDATYQVAMQSVQTDLSNLDSNIDNITGLRSDLGGRMNRIQSSQTQLTQMQNALTGQQGAAENADLAQVITKLTTQQTVYQAALSSGQHLILPTLADVLKQ